MNWQNLVRKEVTPLADQPVAMEFNDHTHQWELLSKTYAPPRRDVDATHLSEEVVQHALFGVTTILWMCLVCKNLRKAYMLGSDQPQLDDLMEKAEAYGPQYIQQDGKTYVVMQYVPQAGNVPIR